jgi:hypothetical protein
VQTGVVRRCCRITDAIRLVDIHLMVVLRNSLQDTLSIPRKTFSLLLPVRSTQVV